jgi:hypothetical protein
MHVTGSTRASHHPPSGSGPHPGPVFFAMRALSAHRGQPLSRDPEKDGAFSAILQSRRAAIEPDTVLARASFVSLGGPPAHRWTVEPGRWLPLSAALPAASKAAAGRAVTLMPDE